MKNNEIFFLGGGRYVRLLDTYQKAPKGNRSYERPYRALGQSLRGSPTVSNPFLGLVDLLCHSPAVL
jgi:hypothetical protein